MHRHEETPPPRPRWLGWALMVFMALVVLGMLNLAWRMLQPGPNVVNAVSAAQSASGVGGHGSAAQPSLATAGLRLVEGSDCLRCHGMERHYVGPSFQQIAARYREQPDAVDYLARKIRNGSVGEWGRIVMPRHPQLSEAQAREMAQWLVSLPVPSGAVQGASAAEAPSATR